MLIGKRTKGLTWYGSLLVVYIKNIVKEIGGRGSGDKAGVAV